MTAHFLLLSLTLAPFICLGCSALIGLWWLGSVLFQTNESMAVDLHSKRPDPTLHLKAVCNRDGYRYSILDDTEAG